MKVTYVVLLPGVAAAAVVIDNLYPAPTLHTIDTLLPVPTKEYTIDTLLPVPTNTEHIIDTLLPVPTNTKHTIDTLLPVPTNTKHIIDTLLPNPTKIPAGCNPAHPGSCPEKTIDTLLPTPTKTDHETPVVVNAGSGMRIDGALVVVGAGIVMLSQL
ncbi:hypothetical protein ACHAQK_009229 [Fusarium lateritium]